MFEEFDKISKAEWLQNIEASLKGSASIQDMYYKVDEKTHVDPFATLEDISDLPGNIVKNPEWKYAVDLSELPIDLINKTALSFLSGGINSLVLKVEDNAHFESLFENIRLDFIQIILDISQSNSPKAIVNAFQTYLDKKSYSLKDLEVIWLFGESDNDTHQVLRDTLQEQFKLGLNFDVSDKPVTEYLAEILCRYYHFLDVNRAFDPLKLMIRLRCNDDFLMEIAKFRAFRILWANMLKLLEYDPDLSPLIYAKSTQSDEGDPEKCVIVQTYRGLSAAIGGADVISLSLMGEEPVFHDRIIQNIHHILSLESHIDKVADPAAGSFFIEQSTEKIALRSWDLFLEKIGIGRNDT